MSKIFRVQTLCVCCMFIHMLMGAMCVCVGGKGLGTRCTHNTLLLFLNIGLKW